MGLCCCLFIIILVVVAATLIIMKFATKKGGPAQEAPPQADKSSVPEQIRRYREIDKNFSRPLFMDFIHVLYSKFQTARGEKKWGELPSYISRELLESAAGASQKITAVDNIILGVSDIIGIDTSAADADRITVELEANYREQGGGRSGENAPVYYAMERWVLQRRKGILSKAPEEITTLHCPSCGSPGEPRPDGTCPQCDQVVNRGDFHWLVIRMEQLEKMPRPPLEISGGEEQGTESPTIYQPDLENQKSQLISRNPGFSFDDFQRHAAFIFGSIQQAWSSRQWEHARPYESEHLFSTHRYWIERYMAEGKQNLLEEVKILNMEVVKVEPDAFFESITVRIKASMKDYTVDSGGKVIDGDRNKPRTFSEYWTFIRRMGFSEGHAAGGEGTCPSCGAPLKISMSGICEYCSSKITSGDFDWVLSAIEQDEAYSG